MRLPLLLIIAFLGCKSLKFTNKPTYAYTSFVFYKSKYQVKDLLDSVILNRDAFFWQEGRFYGEMILNMKAGNDTISFFLLFGQSDLEWVSAPDSVELLVAAISDYQDWKAPVQSSGLAFDSAKKKRYLQILDSSIIKPLALVTERAEPYRFYKLTAVDERPAKWVICKDNGKTNCDTVFIDSYIKDKFLGGYQIIPKDSL